MYPIPQYLRNHVPRTLETMYYLPQAWNYVLNTLDIMYFYIRIPCQHVSIWVLKVKTINLIFMLKSQGFNLNLQTLMGYSIFLSNLWWKFMISKVQSTWFRAWVHIVHGFESARCTWFRGYLADHIVTTNHSRASGIAQSDNQKRQ